MVDILFDESVYLETYPDVAAAVAAGLFGSGREHFLKHGLSEGRVAISSSYDEETYLDANPDVAAAVEAGLFSSGLEHYAFYGQFENRVGVSTEDVVPPGSFSLFDESLYLSLNPDVAAAVTAGLFNSGFDHFQQFGLQEGRISSTFWNEGAYLAANPDVAGAVAGGAFGSGLHHFALHGQLENRPGALPGGVIPFGFNEEFYLLDNPDVAASVNAGGFGSGLEHYNEFGQFEGRQAFFGGTAGSDLVVGFGGFGDEFNIITGVALEPTTVFENGESMADARPISFGVGEVDTLMGNVGADGFVLGTPNLAEPSFLSEPFYVGRGDADFATIKNFEVGEDLILLAGSTSNYRFDTSNGDFNIFFSGDLVGRVEGVTDLLLFPGTPGSFILL
jgi:hypothetical protein